jgi:hypothetical protein
MASIAANNITFFNSIYLLVGLGAGYTYKPRLPVPKVRRSVVGPPTATCSLVALLPYPLLERSLSLSLAFT